MTIHGKYTYLLEISDSIHIMYLLNQYAFAVGLDSLKVPCVQCIIIFMNLDIITQRAKLIISKLFKEHEKFKELNLVTISNISC